MRVRSRAGARERRRASFFYQGGQLLPAKRLVENRLEMNQALKLVVVILKRMAGDENTSRGGRSQIARFADQFQAVQMRHVVIGHQHADIEVRQCFQGGQRIAEGENGGAKVFGQEASQ